MHVDKAELLSAAATRLDALEAELETTKNVLVTYTGIYLMLLQNVLQVNWQHLIWLPWNCIAGS
jgi:hypothetical protein